MITPNILITYDPSHAAKAKDEIKAMLNIAGDSPEFLESGIDGVFLAKVTDSKESVKKLVFICKKEPGHFNYTHRWVPLEEWIKFDIENISNAIAKFDEKIRENANWKLSLSKRGWNKISTKELTIKFTEKINKHNVNLKNPDMLISVEIVGNNTGISLLEKDEILVL
jgi:tRNA acetyltransferase TAN1